MLNNTETSRKHQDLDTWTSLVEDFRVKTSALPAKVKVLPGRDRDYGPRCTELFGKLDPLTSSLKTAQLSFIEDSRECYATFPKAGIMQNGNVYATRLLDSRITVKGCTLLPTPTKSDHKATFASIDALNRYLRSGHQIRMMDILAQKGFNKCQRVAIFEMVMGFQVGHTGLELSGTP